MVQTLTQDAIYTGLWLVFVPLLAGDVIFRGKRTDAGYVTYLLM